MTEDSRGNHHGLVGVNFVDTDRPLEKLPAVVDRLLDEGVRFRSLTQEVPWLVAAEPFVIDALMRAQLDALAEAVFTYFDTLQELYRAGEPTVRTELDGMTPGWLCRIETSHQLEMVRLDVLVAEGQPRITEVEEIFGSAGKSVAMAEAYGLPTPFIVEFLVRRGIEHIIVCDDYPEYLAELEIVARHLARVRGNSVQAQLVSTFDLRARGAVWRFVSVPELDRYGVKFVDDLCNAGIDFVNPLFHGFSTKAALALLHDSRMDAVLERRLNFEILGLLRRSVPTTFLVTSEIVSADHLLRRRRQLVLKVIDCPTQPLLMWGSRGVFFGEHSKRDWESRVEQAMRGQVASADGTIHRARLVASDLVEAHQVDVEFLHPDRSRVCLMRRARYRLGPIYVRRHGGIQFAGGHATFVNTSRKVHLGRHAVCAPLQSSP